ncbi:MAG: hypothetical protein ACR2MO_12425 [Acidimicrobiales bacterium]
MGKTGSGKTTVTALVAMACASRGVRTLAVDTDVSPNLGLSLGLGQDAVDEARPVPRALVAGRGGGSITTDQLVNGFGMATPSGVTLLHAMPSSDDTGGCWCPAHASARGLLAQALDDEAGVSLLDMEAGLDHLERSSGTVAHTDLLLVVMEPSRKSSVTAERMLTMASRHGIERVALVGNKGRALDAVTFRDAARGFGVPLAGIVPDDPGIVDADRAGAGLVLGDGAVLAGVNEVVDSFL